MTTIDLTDVDGKIQIAEDLMRQKGKTRYLKKQERQKYLSKSIPHNSLLTKAQSKVCEGLQEFLDGHSGKRGKPPLGISILKGLDTNLLAYIGLSTLADCCGGHHARSPQSALVLIGRRIQAEIFSKELTFNRKKSYIDPKDNSKIKTTDIRNNILREATLLTSNYGQRISKVYKLAEKEGVKRRDWDAKKCAEVGAHVYDMTLVHSGLFKVTSEYKKKKTKKTIEFVAQALQEIQCNTEDLMWLKPLYEVMTVPPMPYTDLDSGGYHTKEMHEICRLVKSYTYEQGQQIKHDFAKAKYNGDIPKYAKAINALQAVPLQINEDILDILEWVWDENLKFPKGSKFPTQEIFDELPQLEQEVWKSMSDKQKKNHHLQARGIREKNLATETGQVIMCRDLDSANDLRGETIYIPWNVDNRGRIYPIPTFNYHRDDHIKSVFLLANGCELNVSNDKWFKIHLANTGGFKKVDKKSLSDRCQWVDDNSSWLSNIGQNPKDTFETWSTADKPFQFLAACIEYCEYQKCLLEDRIFWSFTAPALDGTNSGVQHFSAASRNKETGKLVNLVPTDKPQDVYQEVCDAIIKHLKAIIEQVKPTGDDTEAILAERKRQAKLWLDYGLTRKHVKKNAMTYAYSSPVYGFKKQIQADIMDAESDIIFKSSDPSSPHPFGDDDAQDKSAFFLAKISFSCVQSVLISAKEGMEFFKEIADSLAAENKAVTWTTPIGFPVHQKYTKRVNKKLTPFLHDIGTEISPTIVKVENTKGEMTYRRLHETVIVGEPRRTQVTVRLWEGKDIDKRRTKQGISPNIIHSYDASHMMSTILQLVDNGVTDFMMIHDSFAVPASQSEVLFDTVRDTFINQYSDHCMYSNIKDSCLKKLNPDGAGFKRVTKLKIPNIGDLDLSQIRNSDYCFS